MRIEVRGKLGFRVATAVVAGLLISSEGDAVMLEWMGKKKVMNHHNEVPFHVLERKWEFGGGPRSVAAAGGVSDATGGTAPVPSAGGVSDATGGTASVPSAGGVSDATGGTASVPSAPFVADATERVPPRGTTDATGGTASVPSAPFVTDATERVPPRGTTDATERVPPINVFNTNE